MLYAPSSSLFVTWRISLSGSPPWSILMGSDHQFEGTWISAWRPCALLCLSVLSVSLFGKCDHFVRKAQNQVDVSLFFSSVYRTIELVDGWNGKVIHTQVYFSKSSIVWLKFVTSISKTPFRCLGRCDDCVSDVYLESCSPWKFSNILRAVDKRQLQWGSGHETHEPGQFQHQWFLYLNGSCDDDLPPPISYKLIWTLGPLWL